MPSLYIHLYIHLASTLLLSYTGVCGSPPVLVEHPADVLVARDLPATLRCEARGQPRPNITWVKNGHEVSTAPSDPLSHRVLLPAGHLFFLRAVKSKREDDRGTYWCRASNADGEVTSRKASLDIAVLRNEFPEEPLDTWVTQKDEVELPCTLPEGHPDPTVSWKKDGETLNLTDGENGRIRLKGTGIVISMAEAGDGGRYQCVATNIAGTRHSHDALLSVYVKPYLTKSPENVSTEVGSTVRFSCAAVGLPRPEVSWVKQDGKMSPARTEVEDRSQLKIRSVSSSDAGKYVCRAENIAGAISAAAFLRILTPPVFVLEPEDKIAKPGAKMTLDCRLDTTDSSVMQFWLRSGQARPLLPGSVGRLVVDSQGSLTISTVTSRDAGWYGCFGVSSTGSSGSMAWLDMKDGPPRPPPIIQLGPVNQSLAVGGMAELHCQFSTGKDQTQTTIWLKEGVPLEFAASDRLDLSDGHNLQIRDLRLSDSGLYTCQVRSSTGQTSASAHLVVLSKEETLGESPPTPDLLAFPASPSKPQLVETGTNSITVQWGKPHRVGASPLRGYQVEYFSSGGVAHWVTAQVQGETYTLTDVIKGSSVIFLVRARNQHGLSPPSLLSDQLRVDGSDHGNTARQKTELLRQMTTKHVELEDVDVVGPRNVRLSWKILDQSDHIRGYHIHIQELPLISVPPSTSLSPHLNTITISGGGTNSHSLTHLQPNTKYRVFIVPYSNDGLVKPSNLKMFTTKEDAPDGFPTGIDLKLLNSTAAVVNWRGPSQSTINGELTGYKIEIFSNNSLVTNFTLEPSATSLLLSNLTREVIYSVRLAAFTRAGMGPFSEPVSLKVEPSLLYQPQFTHPALVFPPEAPLQPGAGLITETWFVSTVGLLAIVLIVSMVGCVVSRRKHFKDKSFGHYTVPVCKVEDGSGLNYLESDTLWINPKATGLSHSQTGTGKGPHLYINNMCPPEYAELEGVPATSPYRNKNHTLAPCYASTSVLESQYPGPPLPAVQPSRAMSDLSSSDKEQSAGVGSASGENSCVSSGQNTDSSSSGGVGGGEERKARAKRSESRQSANNSGSDTSTRGAPVEPRLVETRLATSVGNSPYHRPPPAPPAYDPGLPPVPPLRGPSSYQGVRAGSFNSFGVGAGYNGLEGMGSSHYSVPGLVFTRQASGCSCCKGRQQCNNVNSHYESASIYREGLYLPNIPSSEHNKIYFNSDGSCVKINCDTCKSSLCICKDLDYTSYISDDSDVSESFYADSQYEESLPVPPTQVETHTHGRMAKKSLDCIAEWQQGGRETHSDRETGSGATRETGSSAGVTNTREDVTYRTFKTGQETFGKGNQSMKTRQLAPKKHHRRLSDVGKSKSKKSIVRSSQSASSSPALPRKSITNGSDPDTEIVSGDGVTTVSSLSNKVSDDLSEMVEQIQAIQNDISELAGRPISLVGGTKG